MREGPAHPRLRPGGLRPGRRGLRPPPGRAGLRRRPRRRHPPAHLPAHVPQVLRSGLDGEFLYAAERAREPRTRTAVIAWADYTTPSGIGMDAATARRAVDGAARLTALVRALPGDTPVSPVLPQLRLRGVRRRRARAAGPGHRHSGGGQPRHAGRQGRPPRHLRACVGDAGRRRLDPGRAVPGLRRPRPRRGPDVRLPSAPACCRRGTPRGTPDTSRTRHGPPTSPIYLGLARTARWTAPSTIRACAGRVCPVRWRPDARRGGETTVCAGRGRKSACRIR
ncbi:hypothetical protein SVIOM74S_02215 [Streptomyces violarus]